MSRRNYRALIIGAGVAGLTAAIALRQTGHEVLVFERQPEIRPLGAGLILWSNAISALRSLELDEALLRIGGELGKASILAPDGRILASTDARTISRMAGAPTLAVHRADLLVTLRNQIPDECFRFEHNLVGFQMEQQEVVANFDGERFAHGDFLLGADGIWSTVRTRVHGSQPPRYAGYTAWRSVIQREQSRIVRALESTETWGPGRRFGWVPLSQGRVYWFATKNAPAGQSPDPRGHKAELMDLFGDWHRPIPQTIHASDERQILRHDIYDRLPIRDWGRGRVTLSGDAAHPITPNTGQGAALAIEDALVLASSLQRYTTLEAGLRAYEMERYPRTRMIAMLSDRIGRVGQVENPYGAWVRGTLMRAVPERISARQVEQIASWQPPLLREPVS